MSHHRLRVWGCPLLLLIGYGLASWSPLLYAAVDHPVDLTGKVAIIVTFQSRDNFANEYRYDVTVRNLGMDPIIGESLLLILDRITNVGGDDREPLKNEPLLRRMEVLGTDGETEDGKPYFRVSPDGHQDLLPHADSRPVSVRLRNRDYVQVFTPVFRVLGTKRPPPAPKVTESAPAPATVPGKTPNGKPALDKLIQLLIKKGVLTEEEWRTANGTTP